MDIQGAIFDFDGTLVDSLGVWSIVWGELGRLCGREDFSPTAEDDKKIRTMFLADAMEMIHQNYGLGESGAQLEAFADRILRAFYKEHAKVKPGIFELIAYLKEKGVKMCIATANALDLLAYGLECVGLGDCFEKRFSCKDLNKGKDRPDIYLAALEYLGTDPDRTFVFEDSLTAILTAKSIGMKTVAVFDKCNYGQDEMKKEADVYIAEGESFLKITEQACTKENIVFEKGGWEDKFFYSQSYRFPATPAFTQGDGFIQNQRSKDFGDGFEYIYIFYNKPITAGTKISTTTSFESYGAPMIAFCEKFDTDAENNLRHGHFHEVVLWREGINLWHLFMENDKPVWHLQSALEWDVKAGEKYKLEVEFKQDGVQVTCDGKSYYTRLKNMPKELYVGIAACEQINRFFDFTVE